MNERQAIALKDRLLELAADWVDRTGGHINDVADYQRIVKCVIELTRTETDAAQTVRVILEPPTDQFTT